MNKLLSLLLAVILLTGCASMQGLFGDNVVADRMGLVEHAPRYSDNPQMGAPGDRQYKRMTRSRMEEESDLQSQAGSMWVSEGQQSYLFVQNKTRREGDLLNVKLDGPALKQVETKVGVIKKLLKELEDAESIQLHSAENANGGESRAPASAEAAPKKEEPKKDEKEDLSDVQTVATRIVEKMPDGNYRVKGQQPFMIGKREYKVILTGLIRPEDFNDEGVSSTKLLDPQYDVVSMRRKPSNETKSVL